MKVEFNKNHLDNKAGDRVDLPEAKAIYLQRMGAVKLSGKKETKVIEPEIEHSEPVEITEPVTTEPAKADEKKIEAVEPVKQPKPKKPAKKK